MQVSNCELELAAGGNAAEPNILAVLLDVEDASKNDAIAAGAGDETVAGGVGDVKAGAQMSENMVVGPYTPDYAIALA